VRLPDGGVEDVAAFLGMRRQGFWEKRGMHPSAAFRSKSA
jgi:hypothetical protein